MLMSRQVEGVRETASLMQARRVFDVVLISLRLPGNRVRTRGDPCTRFPRSLLDTSQPIRARWVRDLSHKSSVALPAFEVQVVNVAQEAYNYANHSVRVICMHLKHDNHQLGIRASSVSLRSIP